MRAYDGSTFRVQWVRVSQDADVLDVVTPFRSGRWSPEMPFDQGVIGEIPERLPPRPTIKLVPDRVCKHCYVGSAAFWENGWPTGTPGVVLAPDGFAVDCNEPTGAAYDYGYDLGYES